MGVSTFIAPNGAIHPRAQAGNPQQWQEKPISDRLPVDQRQGFCTAQNATGGELLNHNLSHPQWPGGRGGRGVGDAIKPVNDVM
jgi:hypothetical protein